MASPADYAAQKRARWRSFFEQGLTRSDAEVNAACEAAMRAFERGEDVDAIVGPAWKAPGCSGRCRMLSRRVAAHPHHHGPRRV